MGCWWYHSLSVSGISGLTLSDWLIFAGVYVLNTWSSGFINNGRQNCQMSNWCLKSRDSVHVSCSLFIVPLHSINNKMPYFTADDKPVEQGSTTLLPVKATDAVNFLLSKQLNPVIFSTHRRCQLMSSNLCHPLVFEELQVKSDTTKEHPGQQSPAGLIL